MCDSPHDCDDVHRDQLQFFGQGSLEECAGGAESGGEDHQPDVELDREVFDGVDGAGSARSVGSTLVSTLCTALSSAARACSLSLLRATRTTLTPVGGDAAGHRLADPVAGPGDQRPGPVPVCVSHARVAFAGWAGRTASTKHAPSRQTAAAVRQPACRPDMNASLTVSRTAPATEAGDWAATCRPWASPSRAVAWAGSGAAPQDLAVGQMADVERGEDAADHRDAESAADLAGRVVDRRTRAGLFGPDHSHDRVGGRRGGQPEPAAQQHHLRGDLQVGDVDVDGGHPRERPGEHQQADEHHRLGADPGHRQPGAEHGPDRDRQRDRQDAHAGVQRSEALQQLEELGDQEDESEQGEEGDGHRAAGRAEPQVGEQADVDQRIVAGVAPTIRSISAAASATPKPTSVRVAVQPCSGASMIV